MSSKVDKAIRAIADAGGLVSPSELADEWGITKQAMSERTASARWPRPVKEVGRVKLYLREQVEPFRPKQ